MDLNMLRILRKQQHKNAKYMGKVIRKTESSYTRKERGIGQFTPDEISEISMDLGLTPEQTSYIFLDVGLRKCNLFDQL